MNDAYLRRIVDPLIDGSYGLNWSPVHSAWHYGDSVRARPAYHSDRDIQADPIGRRNAVNYVGVCGLACWLEEEEAGGVRGDAITGAPSHRCEVE